VRTSVLESNAAPAGGAIAAVTLEVSDSAFVANVADDPNGDAPGGAVWIAPFGTFTIERTTFDGNSADDGGGIQTWSSGTLIDVEALGNSAVVGGFLRAETQVEPVTTVDLVGADIHDNTAEVGAGVALVYASGTADAASVIHDNVADLCAGVHLVSIPYVERVSWTGGTVQANAAGLVAPGHGGGLCVDADLGGSAEVADVVVLENEAYTGAGVYVFALGFVDSVDVVLRDLLITANTGVEGAGLGADGNDGRPASANVFLEDVEVVGNLASQNGGGLWVDDAWIGLTNGAVRDNVAVAGGGVFVALAGAVDAAGTDFAGNVPDDVWLETYGATYDAAEDGATFTCLGSDLVCD